MYHLNIDLQKVWISNGPFSDPQCMCGVALTYMMDSVKTEGHDVRAPVSCRIAAALTRHDLASIERHRRVLRLFVAARSYGRRQVES